MMKKILLVNAKRRKCNSTVPHLGLAMLSGVLKRNGHEVLVVDYQFRHNAPSIKKFVNDFHPDVIGITLYTATMREAGEIIDKISKFDIPLMVGGPHATLYSEDLCADNRIDYVFIGESENAMVDIVNNAKIEDKPQLVKSSLPDLEKLPYPDFTSFFQCQEISTYSLLTSRGCPHDCSFCAVHLISSRKWRPRKLGDCVNELMKAKIKFPHLKNVIVYDDNPMARTTHLKEFLRLYINGKINLSLTIINTHAKDIDEELLLLLKEACCSSIALGVEHGHPKVFNRVGKGETLDDIIRAANLIKKYNIPLGLCFIIGLPGDSLKMTKYSIKLAKELKGDFFYWNSITPFKGTRVYDYFNRPPNKIFDVINHSSFIDGDFVWDGACVETPEFSIADQEKAYFTTILKTKDRRLNLYGIPKLLPYVIRHRLYLKFFSWLFSYSIRLILSLFKQVVKRVKN